MMQTCQNRKLKLCDHVWKTFSPEQWRIHTLIFWFWLTNFHQNRNKVSPPETCTGCKPHFVTPKPDTNLLASSTIKDWSVKMHNGNVEISLPRHTSGCCDQCLSNGQFYKRIQQCTLESIQNGLTSSATWMPYCLQTANFDAQAIQIM